MELICHDPDLLRRLGAVKPETNAQHRAMRSHGDMLIRFTEAAAGPMFWPIVVITEPST